jgi:pyridoxine 5-phosphate synthase
MLRLGFHLDHVATVRQARRGRNPDLLAAAHAALLGGADRIAVHLREDRRRAQDRDVELLAETLDCDLLLEIAPTEEMVGIARRVRPATVSLVPEGGEESTSEGALDVGRHRDRLRGPVETLQREGIQVALLVDPAEEALLAANELGADVVELHTGRFAGARTEIARLNEFQALRHCAALARQLGLRVQAGHGLDYRNVAPVAALPEVEALTIGFAVVARALFTGLAAAVREMREAMLRAREIATRGEDL